MIRFRAMLVLLTLYFGMGAVECVAAPRGALVPRKITVDGALEDWQGIEPWVVRGREHLWYGQGMTPEQWDNDADLSYQWRGAWHGSHLYFAIEVVDDRLADPDREFSYLCDCVEIYLDYDNQGGQRVKVLDGREDWLAKCDPRELMGYELHFLPTDPPRVYLDHTDKYALAKPQTDRFHQQWAGRAACRRTPQGYVLEVGFQVPDVALHAEKTIGIEIGVCDDDGDGRESIMMWTGTKGDFWITMDDYGKVTLTEPARFESRRNADGTWGLAITGAGLAAAEQPQPLQIELWDEATDTTRVLSNGYASVQDEQGTLVGTGRVAVDERTAFEFVDRWMRTGEIVRLARTVTVHGSAPGGFMSGAIWPLAAPRTWPEVHWFAPGMIYGGFANLTDVAIGGRAHYRPGDFTVRIREDRLPAPLLMAHFEDGTSLAVLDPAPRGDTTAADANDVSGVSLVDERFQFGALGGQERGRTLALGYWFPGSEGEVTYAGNTYPGGQLHQWRRRFHPIRDGLVQQYEVALRVGQGEQFTDAYPRAWRWAWQTLQPAICVQDLTAVRRSLTDVLAHNTVEQEQRAGIPTYIDTQVRSAPPEWHNMILGFCGKNLEAARFLLREAELDTSARGQRMRALAEKIIASFLQLQVAPPAGEGFRLQSGTPICALGRPEVYLRSYGDDVKALLKAYQREKQAGREHPEWLAWCRTFGDWLLTQQRPDGGFPRSWKPVTGEVIAASPNSSYNAVPLLVLLTESTGDHRYLDAAIRAADFCWSNGQAEGRFVGGTIDNPDVLDKEAATLSLEAYLELYAATRDTKWVPRAVAAANFAATWIYCWNVPMPEDDDDAARHWKQGVPTAGLQLIATGHSLVDEYMSYDADDFAQMAQLTGDSHYLAVARLLLHNTKNMLAVPGRTFDLGDPGWQQEHWSLAPRRGYGLHRGWLPWVATSQLNGIFGLMDLDAGLFEQLSAGE